MLWNKLKEANDIQHEDWQTHLKVRKCWEGYLYTREHTYEDGKRKLEHKRLFSDFTEAKAYYDTECETYESV